MSRKVKNNTGFHIFTHLFVILNRCGSSHESQIITSVIGFSQDMNLKDCCQLIFHISIINIGEARYLIFGWYLMCWYLADNDTIFFFSTPNCRYHQLTSVSKKAYHNILHTPVTWVTYYSFSMQNNYNTYILNAFPEVVLYQHITACWPIIDSSFLSQYLQIPTRCW